MSESGFLYHDKAYWAERFARAQQCPFPDVASVSSAPVKCLVAQSCSEIGCKEESLFIPLLTCCAHLMGVNATIKVHDGWCEPAILWTVLCARRGTGKTSILKQLIRPILELQCEHERQWHLSRPSSAQTGASGPASPPKLLAGPTSLTELYSILEKNGGQMLMLEENLENLHKRLLTDSKGSALHCEELNSLYDAMPKFSSKDGEVSIMTTTCYNHMGMAPPHYIMEMFHNPRLLLYDRYLIACPADLTGQTQPPTSPMPPSQPSIKTVFQTLYMFHRQSREYVFSGEATAELFRLRDKELANLKAQFDHDDATRVALSKSMGQIIRIAGVLKALTTACVFATQATGIQFLKWDMTIDKDTILRAIHIQRYFLEQKLILLHNISMLSADSPVPCMPSTSFQVPVQSTSQSPVTESPVISFAENRSPAISDYHESFVPDFMNMSIPQFLTNFSNKIRRLLEYADDGSGIPASVAAQYSIPPIVHIPGSTNRKPSWVAELFFKKVAELGIGKLCYIKHHANRKYFLRFRRKRPEELTDMDRKLLSNLRVNMDLYFRIGRESWPAEVVTSPADTGLSPFLSPHLFPDQSQTSDRYMESAVIDDGVSVKRELESDDDEENPHSSGT